MPSRKAGKTSAAKAQEEAKSPEGRRPWEDWSLSAEERYNSYKAVLKEQMTVVSAAYKREGITREELIAILDNPETRRCLSEAEQLDKETPEQFCDRIDVPVVLGQNFLGAAAWKEGFKVDVGAEPPLPATITKELLESESPLHPGQLIKDKHLLVLMPKTVDGKPYRALEFDRLCAESKGSGDKLIYDGEGWATRWKSMDWASTPQAQNEWVLMPKSDPDCNKVPADKHFRGKNLKQQEAVHKAHYPEYREAKAVELMTAALLNDVVNGAPRMLDGHNYLRCKEPGASGGRVCVGFFGAVGLLVSGGVVDGDDAFIGRALARK